MACLEMVCGPMQSFTERREMAGVGRRGWKGRLKPLKKRHLEKFRLFHEAKIFCPEDHVI